MKVIPEKITDINIIAADALKDEIPAVFMAVISRFLSINPIVIIADNKQDTGIILDEKTSI